MMIHLLLSFYAVATPTAMASPFLAKVQSQIQERIKTRACDIQLQEQRIPLACLGRLDPIVLEQHCLQAVNSAKSSAEIPEDPKSLRTLSPLCESEAENRRQDLLYRERKSLNLLHSSGKLMNN